MHKTSNICNYYLLPLFKLNTSSFGGMSNFVGSYLDYEGKRLVVEVVNRKVCGPYWNNPAYELDYDSNNHTFIVLKFPEEFYDTVDKFKVGKYSHFCKKDKDLIKKYSGLKYRFPRSRTTTITSDILLALDREEVLRKKIEQALEVTLSEDAELISIPEETCFIHLSL